ncbi:MAG TPA: peptide-methionine (R)-S-oxide reductase MsrB [Candidatus Paceibacterota bacterium]|nr:peptide-methionine (R)-S-oxide reductase MsrB [Candidatus Paceibacterota bacterium]
MDEKEKEEKLKQLTPEELHVTQEKGTETPFQNKYWNNHQQGMYACKVCGAQLFASDSKFDSGTGWPSYDKALPGAVEYVEDTSHGMHRVEVVCKNCGAHLGHVFDDGPTDTTSKRFCINSCSLDFKKEK